MNDLPNTPKPQPALTEEDYDRFDEQLPALAEQATREAYERALQSGLPVAITLGNSVVEVSLDGSVREIKKLPPTRRYTTQRFYKLD